MKHISAITNIKTVEANKKYAWIPKKLTCGKIVWLTDYYEIVTFVSITGYTRALYTDYITYSDYIEMKLSGLIDPEIEITIPRPMGARPGY